MRLRSLLILGAVLLLAAAALSGLGAPGTSAQPAQPAAIRLQAATFTPAAGEQPDIPPGLTVSGYAAGARGYYIVQFNGPVQAAWKQQVADLGGEVLEYIPDFAFKVRMNPAQAARAAELGSVVWVGLFQPAYKISPAVDLNGLNLLRVRIEHGADAGQATAAIARSGATVVNRSENLLAVGADAAQVQEIARVLDVAWMEPYVLPEKHNEYGAGVIVGANSANASGYDGSTQIAAVSDTGLGGGTAATAHPDIPAGRIVNVYNWPGATDLCFQSIVDDGAIDVDSGHGTHTAASVLSDGGANGLGKGGAPAARLVFQATENWATISNYCQIFGGWPANGYFLTGLPGDLRTMYQQAYSAGARIHSNSWGAALAGDYTLNSANTDDFIWNNRDMTITFSAGNEGTDANANGVVDNDSIGSPATAKNVITVGASENARNDNWPCDTGLGYTSHDSYQNGRTCGSMGGNNLLGTYGHRYPADFPAQPLSGDSTAGNAHQMASWSSRGPTDDGRIKPDVVAPGTWILSGFSGLYQEGYGGPVNPQNGVYQWDGWGMPFNAGYKYMGGTSMSNPIAAGAATVVRDFYQKAHIHNASAALVKATLINSAVDLLDENNDGANDNDYAIPNVHEGWGRVNLANATDGSHEFIENAAGLSTNGSAGHAFNLSTAGQPFKVTLVWSDYPSSEAAGQNLVNDLDLVVTAPGGAVYRGNVFSGGWSMTGGSADRTNNVENVYIRSAAAGTWTVQVSGANVPSGPQPFALVVDGVFGPAPTPTATSTPVPAVAMHVGDLHGSVTPGSRGRWNAEVTITVHDSGENALANVLVTGAWSGGASGGASCTTSANGQCSVGVNNLKSSVASATFTVSSLSLGANTYNSGANHDPDGDSNGTTIVVYQSGAPTPTPTPGPTSTPGASVVMHIGDLDGSAVSAPRNRWDAAVIVTVHNASEGAVSGATVDGTWSGAANGGASCVTDGSGQCTVSKSNLRNNSGSAVFTVTNVSLSGSTYNAGANHDPDGDSSGTDISVVQP